MKDRGNPLLQEFPQLIESLFQDQDQQNLLR